MFYFIVLFTIIEPFYYMIVKKTGVAGGDAEQTAKEMIFEAQSQLNKQQQVEHGGAVRGTDAARVQVRPHLLC